MTLLAPTRLDKDDAKERTQNRSDGGTRENPQTHGDDVKGDDRRQNKYGRGDKKIHKLTDVMLRATSGDH